MGLNVDDRHNSISYHGRWSSNGGDSNFYSGTVSSTTNSGATATFKFRGTHVKLYLVVPMGKDGSVRIRATLDSRSPFEQERNAHPYVVYNDIWFEAGGLSDTDHTLVIQNISQEGGNAMQIDRFEIDGSPVSPPAVAPPKPPPSSTTQRPAAPTATVVQSSTVTLTVVQTQTQSQTIGPAITATSAPVSSDGSSTPTSNSSASAGTSTSIVTSASTTPSGLQQLSQGDKTVTAIQIITTAPNGSVQTILSTPSAQGSLGDTSNEVPLGAIVGGVVGGLILFVIAGILVFLLLRRRRKRHIVLGDDSERLTRERGAISPFPTEHEGDTPPNSATVLRQPSSGTTASNSRSRSDNHAFNSDEKQGDPLSSNSAISSNHSMYGTPTSEVRGHAPLPLIETGDSSLGFNIRPHYLSGETLPADSPSIYSQAGPISATPRALGLQDSRDFPPSYQSVGTRDSGSGVRQSALNLLSPRYSSHLGFSYGDSADPQAR